MPTATLILSFDCEGKWGIADRQAAHMSFVTQSDLRTAYRIILQLHKKYNIQSTFAFVAALCMTEHELRDWLSTTQSLEHDGRNWLASAIQQLNAGCTDGWCDETLLEMVVDADQHEICSHGGTHLPYSEKSTTATAVEVDLSLTQYVFDHHRLPINNIIFPRNIVGHRKLLSDAGYRGYRNVDPWETIAGVRGKLLRLAAEFLPLDRSSLPANALIKDSEDLFLIPPAKFLNASIGPRRFVPKDITHRRIDALLEFAVRNNRVAHIYSHPHNFISDQSLPEKLEYLLKRADEYRNQGKMRILTMNQWRIENE